MLKVISRSTFDLQTVLETLVELAARLCAANRAVINQRDGEVYRVAAKYGFSREYAEYAASHPVAIDRGSMTGRAALEGRSIHVPDVLADPEYRQDGYQAFGFRTALAVPLLREGATIGVFVLTRNEVNPFTDKQIDLVTTFGDQAVIAIENARLLNELRDSLQQQMATSEVLQVISASPGDVKPVFDTMLEKAARVCDANFGNIYRWDGDALHLAATHNTPQAFAEARRRSPLRPDPNLPLGRVIANKTVIHVADAKAEEAFARQRHPAFVAAVELGGARTFLFVPMLKEGELIGLFALYRQEVRPFTDKQIALVTNFAAQAVIAIENARLLTELRQRTNDLTEALQQQTARSEVLHTISSSPGDLEPVFAAMLEKAVHICDAKFGNIYRWDGDALQIVATHNTPPAYAEHRRQSPFRADQNNAVARMIKSKEVVHVFDAAANETYAQRTDPAVIAAVELGGIRSALVVPMLKEGELIGAFIVSRQEVRPFTDKQIALVTNFAAQAIIAIENARLLNELRQRTTDLSESLEQQTATSEVLQVISNSPGDLEPIFAAMLEKAVRICDAKFGNIYRWDGETLKVVAMHNTPRAFAEFRRRTPYRPSSGYIGRMVATKKVVHIVDAAVGEPYTSRASATVAAVELGGVRTGLLVPMLKESELVGAFTLFRQEVRPFTDKQIELVTNLASQAVIAIENARLLGELHERNDQLQVQSEELAKLNQELEQRVSDQVGEIERMGRLRRFLPPQVADLIVASGTEKELQSHRREITALFCDLRGFTGFTESADAEDVMSLLRDYHAAVGEIIIKYSGTLERYAGDGVMVIFNDPVPVENPALQAVLMALEMRYAIGALTEKWRRLGHDIGFGIGIAHGFATLGTIGFEGRFDYAAIGTVSNVASRLCDEAKPGQILISPRVLMAVEDAVTVEPVGEFELKGIRRPIAAYNVVAALPPSP